jgi:hypothetical protein
MGVPVSRPSIRIFVSYSHKDRKLLAELRELFKPAADAREIPFWSDRDWTAGYHREPGICDTLEAAEIYLFLVSRHFLASDYSTGRYHGLHPQVIRPCKTEPSKK